MVATTTTRSDASSGAPEATMPFTSIHMLNQSNGWALTASEILTTSDSGQHWKDVTPANAHITQYAQGEFLSSQAAWVASPQPNAYGIAGPLTLLHTSDGGQHWQFPPINDQARHVSLPDFVSTTQGWLEVSQGPRLGIDPTDIFHTSDGGLTWNKIASANDQDNNSLPISGDKMGISFRDAQHGWATGDVPSNTPWLYMTNDGGQTWQQSDVLVPQTFGSVEQFATMPPVLFGNDGVMPVQYSQFGSQHVILYVTHDGGQSWIPTTFTTFTGGHDVYVVDMQHAWATNKVGIMYTTNDGGQHWSQISTLPEEVGELSFTDTTNGWAVGNLQGNAQQLLHTTDGGKTWEQIDYTIHG